MPGLFPLLTHQGYALIFYVSNRAKVGVSLHAIHATASQPEAEVDSVFTATFADDEFFVLSRMYVLVKEYRSANQNHLAIQATAQTTELLYQLHNEYGLSVQFSAPGSPQEETRLLQQQQITSDA